MKKKILLLAIFTFLLIGCSMSNTPTSKVEELLSKYQRLDNDISMGINSVLDEQNLTDVHKERYRKLLETQYKNLSYEIKDEIIDGDTAMVIVEIEVIDYKKAINDLTFDSMLYTKESFDEEKLDRLEEAKDKVTYTLELSLTKDKEGTWKLNALTNEQIKKIQGMY
jgi:hypothetical protein